MDRKQFTSPVILFIFLSISISTALRYQTFSKPDHIISTLSMELIHRDEYSDLSRETLLYLRLQRDDFRVQSLSAHAAAATQSDSGSDVTSGLALGSGEYFALLGVGTPAKYLYMALDTGSDVAWLQCSPCTVCYYQPDPIFDPEKSSSFLPVSCRSNLCQQLQDHGCDDQERCTYRVKYADGSTTTGEFSTETLTLGETTNSVPKVPLGCGHDNQGMFKGSAGLLGLGRGVCLFRFKPRTSSREYSPTVWWTEILLKKSSILFGESSVWQNAVFTPLLRDTHYYVNLTGISVGDFLVPGIDSSVFESESEGVIIDSGTIITRLVEPAYGALRDAFRAGVRGMNLTSNFSVFDTCYDHLRAQPDFAVPIVELHFDGGANMLLQYKNYLVKVDENGTLCFGFASSTLGLSIIGNLQQQGFRLSFDLKKNRVGFAPNSC